MASEAELVTRVDANEARTTDEDARASLLRWYDANKRSLPWRRRGKQRKWIKIEALAEDAATPSRDVAAAATLWRERAFESDGEDGEASVLARMSDDQYAYGILVSEIMSQQTQIERVAEYWRRWTARWPTAEALAEATIEEVNEEWAGLGYYRRAKFLLNGAIYVRDALKGKYPRDVEGLSKIPGVGPYTASAVASIAFGAKTAAVDGNVYRVITRAKMIKGDPLKGDAAKEIRRVADAFVDAERPGDFNQAMMELGATVCAPQNPKCDSCPISTWCGGFAKQRETSGVFKVTAFPETAKKAEKRQEQRAFVVLRRTAPADADAKPEYEYLLSKRPEGGLLGGLWEFPNALIAIESDDAFALRPKSDVRDAQDALCEELGASSRRNVDAVAGKAVHVFSHIRQVMHYQLVDCVPLDATGANGDDVVSRNVPERELKWFPAHAFEESGVFSSGVVKVYAKCAATSVARAKPNASGAQKRLRDAGASREIDASQTSIKAFFGSAAPASSPPLALAGGRKCRDELSGILHTLTHTGAFDALSTPKTPTSVNTKHTHPSKSSARRTSTTRDGKTRSKRALRDICVRRHSSENERAAHAPWTRERERRRR